MSSKDTSVPSWVDSDSHASASKGEISSSGNKPRFVPKIPIKKEKTTAVVVENGTAKLEKPAAEKSSGENKFRNKSRDSEGGRGGGGGRNPNFKPNNGRGGGRGQWVMPTGTAFFTGNATAPLPPVPAAKAENVFRISRPNEDLLQAPARPQKAERKADLGKEEVFDSAKIAAMYAAKAKDEYDSDDVPDEVEAVDETPLGGDVSQEEGTGEAWPPAEYNPKAPLTLPLGPKTASLRMMLAAEPILANPSDTEGLLKEELSSLFLLQMPSDLQFDKILESRKHLADASEPAVGGAAPVNPRLVNGKLGKLQLLSSGRVRLVTESGLTYHVSSGLAASFSQTLAAIDVRDVPVDPITSGAGASSSSSSGSKALGRLKKAGAASNESSEPTLDPSKVGDIHFMGNITKKLVLTPDYEIGTKKSKIPTENYLRNNSNNINGNSSHQDEMVEDVE